MRSRVDAGAPTDVQQRLARAGQVGDSAPAETGPGAHGVDGPAALREPFLREGGCQTDVSLFARDEVEVIGDPLDSVNP